MGMIDIAWIPLLHRTEIVMQRSGYDFLTNFARLKQWRSAVISSNIPKSSVSEDFEDRFSDFYLSERTYLGQLANG